MTLIETMELVEKVLSSIFAAGGPDSYFKSLVTETGELSIAHICNVSMAQHSINLSLQMTRLDIIAFFAGPGSP